jgi:dienelactone hydrolase
MVLPGLRGRAREIRHLEDAARFLRQRQVAAQPERQHRCQKFFFMGYCTGGPFALNLMERAPDRVVAAVLCQPVGHRRKSFTNPTRMFGPPSCSPGGPT